jgi:ABC-type proline/glycine betaine transport system permease subunit
MDHDTLVLVVELMALAVAVALGIWRYRMARANSMVIDPSHWIISREYDMRRDGQRMSVN